MTSLQTIEKAVRDLPRERLAKFRQWFERFEAQEWDAQFERDVREGKLDALADQALKHLKAGRCAEL